jgi:hypothetical protein
MPTLFARLTPAAERHIGRERVEVPRVAAAIGVAGDHADPMLSVPVKLIVRHEDGYAGFESRDCTILYRDPGTASVPSGAMEVPNPLKKAQFIGEGFYWQLRCVCPACGTSATRASVCRASGRSDARGVQPWPGA